MKNSTFIYKLHKQLRTFVLLLCSAIWFGSTLPAVAAPRVQNTEDHVPVIVIDPGHGGENEGTTQNGFLEKEMTLVTATAMYEELLQYDNVEVYITRNSDVDLSLKERAEIAAALKADFLFSLHYNASENHTMFGSEVWISSVPPYHAYGYQFGHAFLTDMQEKGLFIRGVKTRLGDNGDYYGVIREAVALEVPAVILEHCYVDHPNDTPYCEAEEEWIAFGKADALAVAKYFGLSSRKLGVDYSEESLRLQAASASGIIQSTSQDNTSPDVCLIEAVEIDFDTGKVVLEVSAADYDSTLLYYDYSLDGGETYSELFPWPDSDILSGQYRDTFPLTLTVPSGMQPDIILRAYNMSDLYTESNKVSILQHFRYDETGASTENKEEETEDVAAAIAANRHSIGTTTFMPDVANTQAEEEDVSFLLFLKLCLGVVVVIFVIFMVYQHISYIKRRKRRRQRRKELEEEIYHNQ